MGALHHLGIREVHLGVGGHKLLQHLLLLRLVTRRLARRLLALVKHHLFYLHSHTNAASTASKDDLNGKVETVHTATRNTASM